MQNFIQETYYYLNYFIDQIFCYLEKNRLIKVNNISHDMKCFMLKPIFDFEITKRMKNGLETEGGLLVDLITNN